MCGIAGVLDPQASTSRRDLKAMVQALVRSVAHRGPDASGYWIAESSGIALGHQRLSILDLSRTGDQPMASAGGRFVLTYNGEIYNYQRLRSDLEHRGAIFRGTSDTEVMVNGLEVWGPEETLARADGMFAFAAWDTLRRELVLARDRFGEKPLHWGWVKGSLLFSSELRGIAKVAGPLSIDPAAVADVIAHKCVQGSRTIYTGFEKLPPGHYAVVDASGRSRVSSYWSAVDVAMESVSRPLSLTMEDAAEELTEKLQRIVASRMVADVPVGAFLSGGVDSAGIVAFMRMATSRTVRTFTVGLDDQRFDESDAAALTARHLGTDHTPLRVTPAEILELVPTISEVYDEPFADSSQLPTHLVSALAVRDVKVALTGDGGDEIFGGYNRHVFGDQISAGHRLLGRSPRRYLGRLLLETPADRIEQRFRRMAPLLPARLRIRLPADKARKVGRLLSADDPAGIYRALVTDTLADHLLVRPTYEFRGSSPWGPQHDLSFSQRAMLSDTIGYLPDDILVKVDRAAMHVSLETRAPYLSPELFAWVWRLPERLRRKRGLGKLVLRRVVASHLGDVDLSEVKSGFGVPVGEWLRGPLRTWALDLLSSSDSPIAGLLDRQEVHRLWKQHDTAEADHTDVLWSLLMLHAWGQSAPAPLTVRG